MPLSNHLGQPLPTSRRGVLRSAAGAPLLLLPHAPRVHAATAATAKPVLDQPMRRLRLPKGTVGRDYVLLQLKLGGQGPFDFVVDTGLTAELITPHLKQVCGRARWTMAQHVAIMRARTERPPPASKVSTLCRC
jgi:hypothetical protein